MPMVDILRVITFISSFSMALIGHTMVLMTC